MKQKENKQAKNIISYLHNIENHVYTHTSMNCAKLLPYFRSNTSLISPKSISDRPTTSRINVRSSVPIPAILSCNRTTMYSLRFRIQWMRASRLVFGVPENSLSIAFSKSCPVSFSYSSKISRNWDLLRWHRIWLNVDSSVPWNSSPARSSAWASLYAFSLSVVSVSSRWP